MRRVVHLGLGAFHRAHQAVYTEDAGGWEIAGVAQRSRTVIDALREQGHRYALLERGPEEDTRAGHERGHRRPCTRRPRRSG